MSNNQETLADLMTRRRLLETAIGGLCALSLPGCVTLPPRNEPFLPPGVKGAIDVHCHVFNAADLPVKGFVDRVYFELFEENDCVPQTDLPATRKGLLAFLVQMLIGSAPTAREELDYFARTAPANWPTDEETREAFEQQKVARTIEQTYMAGARRRALADAGPSEELTFLKDLSDEVGFGKPLETLERRRGLAGGPSTADEFATKVRSGQGSLSVGIRWALMLLRPRHEIIRFFARLYGGPSAVSVLFPSLVDFQYWLDDEPASPLSDQIDVMDQLQRWAPEHTGLHMHCFVPFDPWREIVEGNALDLVQHAILEKGFIGAKLYPPMGYFPAGNAQRNSCYPRRSEEIERFAEKIDAALNKLYDWCQEHDVPIEAHANDSQGAGPGFATRSHPRYWRDVLANKKKLRVNLGHFGDFQEALRTPPQQSWERTTGELMAAQNQGTVYADLSYLREIIASAPSGAARTAVQNSLRTFFNEFPIAQDRLMFGTDWSMLGREVGHAEYGKAMYAHLQAVGQSPEVINKVFRENAANYLGLRPSQKNRGRLEAYYARHNLDASWLTEF